jgi:hypothetical protein
MSNIPRLCSPEYPHYYQQVGASQCNARKALFRYLPMSFQDLVPLNAINTGIIEISLVEK